METYYNPKDLAKFGTFLVRTGNLNGYLKKPDFCCVGWKGLCLCGGTGFQLRRQYDITGCYAGK